MHINTPIFKLAQSGSTNTTSLIKSHYKNSPSFSNQYILGALQSTQVALPGTQVLIDNIVAASSEEFRRDLPLLLSLPCINR